MIIIGTTPSLIADSCPPETAATNTAGVSQKR